MSSEDGEERGLRDEEIEGKELGRGNTGQKEMAEDEEENLDEEEGKPGIDKEQNGKKPTRERKQKKKEGGQKAKAKKRI